MPSWRVHHLSSVAPAPGQFMRANGYTSAFFAANGKEPEFTCNTPLRARRAASCGTENGYRRPCTEDGKDIRQ